LGADEIVIALNTKHEPRRFAIQGEGTLLLSTYLDREETRTSSSLLLRPDEGVIIKLAA
jgi:hypothetical protein